MHILNHKGFEGSAEVDMERRVCRGRILFIQDLVTYEAESPAGLQKAFVEAVEDYLDTCRSLGKQPDKPAKGQFQVRIPPELHKAAIRKAAALEVSLNEVAFRALDLFVNGGTHTQTITNVTVQGDPARFQTFEASADQAEFTWKPFNPARKGATRGN